MREDESVGQLVRAARESKGLSLEDLAKELKLPLRHLQAIEADDWVALPPGRPRPLARQLAERLGVDLEFHTGAFQIVPGGQELEPPDPRRERLERLVMGVLTGASAIVILWLVVPGPSLGHKPPPSYLAALSRPSPAAAPGAHGFTLSGPRGAPARGARERAGPAGEPAGPGHRRHPHRAPRARGWPAHDPHPAGFRGLAVPGEGALHHPPRQCRRGERRGGGSSHRPRPERRRKLDRGLRWRRPLAAAGSARTPGRAPRSR
ncbi:MAG: helix-turn-helix domain-containing protein [Holophagaceae bacterium]|uniref:Helix-turn-helix domain-containing protein n=1 Tax=Candidatus Geothrix odensensis TaxID=2954440 RepID=A0A936F1Z8_9BACT|nr:helix-turn-helix domain-containing protein [Candidatus Geothrix odensensis]